MSFECAAVIEGQRCRGEEQGDTVYLEALTFCAPHQEAFEDLVTSKKLLLEIASARMCRTDWGKAAMEATRNPQPRKPIPERRDMRAEATVYFIRCEGYIKIGYAIAPHKRLRQLQATDGTKYPEGINCSTAALIQTEPGGFDRERELHSKFSHLRHTGEWFTESKELTDYIKGLAA
jgi:hypothetical protein